MVVNDAARTRAPTCAHRNALTDLTLPSLPSLTELIASGNRIVSLGALVAGAPELDVVDIGGE